MNSYIKKFNVSNKDALFSLLNTYVCIAGVVKKQGIPYVANVFLIHKSTMKTIDRTTSKVDGSYQFLALPKGIEFMVMAIDTSKQFNAVIQDNVVPT